MASGLFDLYVIYVQNILLTTWIMLLQEPNPYASKFSIEDKIVMGVEAYLSRGNVNKKELKERLDAVLV